VLGQQYQARYAREQFAIQLRFKEQEDVTAALKEVGALADAPTSRALSLLDAVLDNRPDSTVRRLKARFDEAAEAWNLGYNRARVLAWVYFKDTLFLPGVDSMAVSMSHELARTLERERDAKVRLADTVRLLADPTRLKEYSRIMKEMARTVRRATELIRNAVRMDQEGLFIHQMLWAGLISTRQAGSFDPLARYTLTPLEEVRAQDSLRKLMSLDSIAARKPGARPDTR
jgi:hypothetical protein